jgi:trehalose 6-phosphate synthase/phosphatase
VWKQRVYPILEHFVDRTPGSFIEEKEFSLVWHYRMADPEFGDWLANDLIANLEHMLADSPVKPVKGQRTVEVKLVWANKRQVCSRFLMGNARFDFILAAGDDATDEDMFAQLPSRAWTIHVGRNRSRAKYFVVGPDEMVALLAQLVASPGTQVSDYAAEENGQRTVASDIPLINSLDAQPLATVPDSTVILAS